MAPKRQRRESAGSSSFDSSKFVSAAARDRFNEQITKRIPIRERGIWVDRTRIVDEIERRKWQKFTAQPDSAVVPLVREFYANAKEMVNNKVMVRGKMIAIDQTAINRYYKLSNVADEEDEFQHFLMEEGRWDLVLEYLATPATKWKMAGNRISSFSSQALTRDSKAWHYFVGAKLMPVKHFSDITCDRAALVYAIQKQLTIDVGKIINREIVRCAQSGIMGLFFPSLITDLCKAAGVKWSSSEEWVPPINIIDAPYYFKLSKRNDEQTAAASSSQGPAPPPPPSQAPSSSAAPAHDQAILDQIYQLHLRQKATHGQVQICRQQLRAMRSWFTNIDYKLNQWQQSQAAYQQAMVYTMDLVAAKLGINLSQRPTVPVWNPSSTEPINTNEEEEEDDGEEAEEEAAEEEEQESDSAGDEP